MYANKFTNLIDFNIGYDIGNNYINNINDNDIQLLIGSDSGLRPYLKYFKNRRRGNKILNWIKDHIIYSIFFMGWYNLIPIYLFQILIVVLLDNEVISTTIIPSNFLIDRIIGTFYFFLLSFTITNVVSNSREALKSFVGALQGTVSEISAIFLGIVREQKPILNKTYEIQRFNSQSNSVTNVEKISLNEMLLEVRHILVTYFYVLSKIGRNDFEIHTDKLSTLPIILKNELLANTLVPSNYLYISKLLFMLTSRLDILYEFKGLNDSTQVISYGQIGKLSGSSSDVDFAASDLNQPMELLDALSVITWILLCYYSFSLFEEWELIGTLIIIWIPNLLFNGAVNFARNYNNPYELSQQGKLIGVDIKYRTHETVRNFDQIFVHLLKILNFQQKK